MRLVEKIEPAQTKYVIELNEDEIQILGILTANAAQGKLILNHGIKKETLKPKIISQLDSLLKDFQKSGYCWDGRIVWEAA